MSHKPPKSIRTPDGYTTRNRAGRYIRDGRARWTDASHSAIEFLDSHQHRSVTANAENSLHARITGRFYDAINRRLTRAELRHLPMVGNLDLAV